MTDFNNNIGNNLNNIASVNPESLKATNDIFYNCTECSSLIEILSIDENKNIIEFKCLNKDCHDSKKTMTMK